MSSEGIIIRYVLLYYIVVSSYYYLFLTLFSEKLYIHTYYLYVSIGNSIPACIPIRINNQWRGEINIFLKANILIDLRIYRPYLIRPLKKNSIL